MLRPLRRLPQIPLPKRTYATNPPPAAGPYKPPSASTPPPARKPTTATTTPQPTSTPATPAPPLKPTHEPLDPARGAAASLKAAREGVLDPRYKAASRRVVAIICAVPIFLVTSWVLFQRRFMGVEQKKHTARERADEGEGGDAGVEVVDGK
ncbi:hypothetical protein Q7P37_007482 [Cladosporium fusiforme]